MPEAPAAARPIDFIALGRAAVDLYGEQVGGRLEDMGSFAKYLGGCPANISVGAARLGLKPAMLTRVGDEHMGRFVRETLAAEGVDVSHVRTDASRLTALVVLGIRDQETFPLIFYRENCADMAVAPDDFSPEFLAKAKALVVTGTHFSTASTDATSRTAMRYARAAGTKVALDIDYRPVLWGLTGHGLGERRFVASGGVSAHLQSIAPMCDLIVGTEEEIHIAGGSTDTLAALRRLREVSSATIVVKRGPQGCVVFTGAIPATIEDGIVGPGFPVEVYNVLGAGDGFMAGLLRGWLGGADWPTACMYANACGALVVSRHGCAPAMPTWVELQDFLSRAKTITKAHEDARISYLHRVTTRRGKWRQICALAFDHRLQFETLARQNGVGCRRVVRFKELIAEAARRGAAGTEGAGAIVDDRYGRNTLYALSGANLWLARPVERPGATPLEFEHGPDPALTLRTWPLEHVVKCLVIYHPDDPPSLRALQEERVAGLFRACVGTGHELLLEIVPPNVRNGELADALARAVDTFYAAGVQPDWWKLPPLASSTGWRTIGEKIRAHDPHCRGVVILGIDADDRGLEAAFGAARDEPLVRGFAVGRHIFWSAAEDWFAGRIGDDAAVAVIAEKYRRVIGLWQARQNAREAVS
ncbi:MAG TPA: 5-dehydro-2-deoxygluconokinase [Alphaproteobacteria bacterium]|nr:5-dehydro-2-deoxygluconokinase [Alphaproteobacteria bacterium]